MKNVVIIGGGTGTSTLLSGFRQFPTNNSVIVSSADDGGSTGVLRRELGVMPAGDIRQCLLALSYTEKPLQALFSYRFHGGTLAGHTAGNIILAALEKSLGSNEEAIKLAAKILNVRGQVVPVTAYPTVLTATLVNGKKIIGEHNIDQPDTTRPAIKSLSLSPGGAANPRALRLVRKADAVVFGPGDLFTSTIPNLLPKGMKDSIRKSKAKKIFVANIMTKHGQTDSMKISDCVKIMQIYMGAKFDAVIINTAKPDARALKAYRKEKAYPMKADRQEIQKLGPKVVAEDLLSKKLVIKMPGDGLHRSKLRHDSDKLAKIIYEIIQA